jgi:DnaJ-class molecular chaperone
VVELDVDVEETDEPSFDCTACNGTGEGYGRRCSTCRGSGIDRSAVLAAREEGATW